MKEVSCEIEAFVETHICELRGILRRMNSGILCITRTRAWLPPSPHVPKSQKSKQKPVEPQGTLKVERLKQQMALHSSLDERRWKIAHPGRASLPNSWMICHDRWANVPPYLARSCNDGRITRDSVRIANTLTLCGYREAFYAYLHPPVLKPKRNGSLKRTIFPLRTCAYTTN